MGVFDKETGKKDFIGEEMREGLKKLRTNPLRDKKKVSPERAASLKVREWLLARLENCKDVSEMERMVTRDLITVINRFWPE